MPTPHRTAPRVSSGWAAPLSSVPDFSFYRARTLADAYSAHFGHPLADTSSSVDSKLLSSITDKPESNTTPNLPPQCSMLRLASNTLSNVVGLAQFWLAVCPFANAPLRMLDLSFNHIAQLDTDLQACTSLTHLYLHANQIADIGEIAANLRRCAFATRLLTLTLHGNPVVAHPDCKRYALDACPRLRHLDFCAVTDDDRYASLRRV